MYNKGQVKHQADRFCIYDCNKQDRIDQKINAYQCANIIIDTVTD